MQKTKRYDFRRIVDVCMVVLLLCLMSYQVTGEEKHEWPGISMTLTVILHQILNRRWYASLFKGRYNAYRSVTTAVNLLLLGAMLVTAFCGMSMSEYAVPFLYRTGGVMYVRPTHLAMSHWAFVLMGLHLGLHVPLMMGKPKRTEGTGTVTTLVCTGVAGVGLWLFLRNGMPNYLFFRVPFAFLDYEKSFWLVFLENALMLSAWVFAGAQIATLCLKRNRQRMKKPSLIAGSIAAADGTTSERICAAPIGQRGRSGTWMTMTPSCSAIRTGGRQSRCRLLPSWKNMTFRANRSFPFALTAEAASGRASRPSRSLHRMRR